MFETFYSLKENPFNITADPSFFFGSKKHSDALNQLQYGLETRKGIMLLTGEVGTGKTTLCRLLLDRISQKTMTAFILNPSFSQLQLLQLIAQDLGIQETITNKLSLINALNEFLLKAVSRNLNVAVIIDEAQNLNVNQLEQIRLLSNLETEKAKLLQIILVGQPELLDTLSKKSIRQLAQRIVVRHHIGPLEKEELSDYIHHRLHVAGATDKLFFEPEAISAIHHYSHGTPRIINILCERALIVGFTLESFTITKDIVDRCAKETGHAALQGAFS